MADMMKTAASKIQEPSFQAYQRAFTQHIRDPKAHSRPPNVPAKRMAIYTEIVYNNIDSTLSACFPVAKSLLSAKKWQVLVRSFMADYRASTPFFREISQQFLQHLAAMETTKLKLPEFLPSLLHYEWVELALSVLDVAVADNAPQDVLLAPLILNPALYLLQYAYPVHQISVDFQPKKPAKMPTYLLVFRNANHQIQFIELNPITFQLASILQNASLTGEQVLQKLAAQNPQITPEVVLQFGAQTLAELAKKEVIFSTKKAQ
ncbi:MAG TPA: putative DNA-binding domain-containing protein [Methylotenera sp.]|nr:putative DNA-binding domain-containing protein [Methylotenera sp.]HPH05895.1 putative DNA-binding domain-containing protein [Methylotenera sp.]HPN00677.1 putative DNA-binding domain-containing protein [Methylotenera sp.]